MPSVLLDRVAHFFTAFQPDASRDVRVSSTLADDTEARLNVRINATQDALCKTRLELEDEKSRSKKWERRAVAASADLAAARGSTADDVDRLTKQVDALEQEKIEFEHRVTRLNRMLTVAEEQRGIALARLAGFTGGIEGVQEENRILRGTVTTLESELETMKQSWQEDAGEKDEKLQDWEDREVIRAEHVTNLEEKYDDLSLEKHTLAEKLSKAEMELLEREADRCLVNVFAAEKERLMERVEQVSQMAWKVPHLESDNHRLESEVREGKRRLEDMAKLSVTIKKKHDKLAVHAREREQYGESMAQMFEDMKKECERLRRERDEKSRLCESMTETHENMRSKQEGVIESLQKELKDKVIEATTSVTNAKLLQAECETKDKGLQEFADSYNRVAALLGMDTVSDGNVPDASNLESKLSNLMSRMQDGEARVATLSDELDMLTKENERSHEHAEKLTVDINRAKQANSEMEERVQIVRQDNARLHARGAEFEAEVNKLSKTSQVYESRMKELITENDALQSEIARAAKVSKTLQDERNSLRAEVQSMQSTMASEREQLSEQLAERTDAFENELNNAREEYRIAAENFETRRQSMNRRLTTSEQQKAATEQGLAQKELLVKDSAKKVKELAMRCVRLEEENDGLKESKNMRVLADDNGDILALREMLAESEDERKRLLSKLSEVEGSQERRLSSSSVSSDEDIVRRVQELELSLSAEAKAKEAQKQRLCEAERRHETMKRQMTDLEETAKEKEMEAEKLRGEMASIYSRMRKMACVSLPPGAEELLDDDDDLRRLNEVREAARREEGLAEQENRDDGREGRKLPAQKRRLRVGVMDNKTRFRV